MNNSVEISNNMNALLLQKKFYELQILMMSKFAANEQFEEIETVLTVMLERGFSEKVIAVIQQLLHIREEFKLLLILGKAESLNGNYDAAIEVYSKANSIKQNSVEVIFSLGVISQKNGNNEEAIKYFKKVIEIKSDLPEAFYNLGNICRLSNKYEEAEAYYKKCLKLSSQNADCLYNIGVVSEKQFKYKEALEYYNKAIALNPNFVDAHWNKALLLLLFGSYKEGWREYEWRLRMKKHRRNELNFQYWNGENLNGKKLLVYDEQGFGDTFHFMRFVSLLKRKYSVAVSFECKKEIYPLFKNDINFSNHYIREEKKYLNDEFDFKVSLLSLPSLLNINEDDMCVAESYIEVDAQNFSVKLKGTNKIKLGFVWSGNTEHQNDEFRSIQIEQLLQVFESQKMQLYSLQKRDKTDDKIDRLFELNNVIDLNNRIKDFHDTAEIISQLDLVVTVDTSVAHLAGAMMKPVWILLPANPDWRWGLNGETTFWYSTAKLFRQNYLGDWNEVFNVIKKELINFESEDKKTDYVQMVEKAVKLFNNSGFNEAAEIFENIVKNYGSEKIVLNNLAMCYQKTGLFNKAVKKCNESIKLYADYLPAYSTLAINYFYLGQKDKAVRILILALNKNPKDRDILFNLANIYHRTEEPELAEKYYEQLYMLGKQSVELIYNYALLLIEKNNYEKAKSILDKGEIEYPEEPQLLFLTGNIEKHFERFKNAELIYSKVIELSPDYIDAYLNLANTFYLMRDLNSAFEIYSLLKSKNIDDARIDYSLGVLSLEKNKYEIAEGYFREAIAKNTDNPDFHVALAEILFSIGDYKTGWEEFDWRYKRKEFQNKKIILPNKLSDLAEKNILIYEEQGIGDTFQFIRFAKKIKTKNNKITFAARKDVQKLIEELEYIDAVVDRDFVSDKFDYMFPLVSLGKFFVSDIRNIGRTKKYININNINLRNIRKTNNINIGICWRGNSFPVHNRKRHTELADFVKLFDIDSTAFFCLQKDITIDEKNVLRNFDNVTDLSSQLKDFNDTAAFCSQMDLIISVDTAVLHLTAAMGKTAWALLTFSPDWRWQIKSDKSPWYPTMKLFRQKIIFEWDNVFDNIKEELKNYTLF